LYSSLTGFAFTFKPLWAPLLELGKTKKFFVVLMQFILAGVFLALAAALKMPAFIVPAVVLLMVAALAGATQDLVTDGVYVTTLSNKHMAAFSGVQSMSWSIGPIVAGSALVLLVGKLAGETGGAVKPPVSAYASAWLVTFIVLGVADGGHGLVAHGLLPQGSKAADAPKTLRRRRGSVRPRVRDFLPEEGRVEADRLRLLLSLRARFARQGLDVVSARHASARRARARQQQARHLERHRHRGLHRWIAAGGWFVAKRGLKRSLLILCMFLNVPNVTFLYLGWFQPESIYVIGLIFCIEKLGWGIGAVGHMVYMMQQIAPGPYKMAHYAFATGFGLSLCMTITGAASGYIQQAVGYQTYFIIVLLAAAPSILFTLLAPFHHGDATRRRPPHRSHAFLRYIGGDDPR
jgi:PAT family beta-lactamase induction signal transducer AmpG